MSFWLLWHFWLLWNRKKKLTNKCMIHMNFTSPNNCVLTEQTAIINFLIWRRWHALIWFRFESKILKKKSINLFILFTKFVRTNKNSKVKRIKVAPTIEKCWRLEILKLFNYNIEYSYFLSTCQFEGETFSSTSILMPFVLFTAVLGALSHKFILQTMRYFKPYHRER